MIGRKLNYPDFVHNMRTIRFKKKQEVFTSSSSIKVAEYNNETILG